MNYRHFVVRVFAEKNGRRRLVCRKIAQRPKLQFANRGNRDL